MAFDGIVTKVISDELQDLAGARIDKILQPNKNEIVLGLYLNGKNYALDICINPQNYRINLTTHPKPNPKVALNFCMLLRKHLIGLKLKSVITSNLERLVILDIEGFDEFEDVVSKKLIIELMGKHGNIILVDERNIIIDSIRHIKSNDLSNRNILPKIKYIFPTITKNNFFEQNNFKEFKSNLPNNLNIQNTSKEICNNYNGISISFIENIIKKQNITNITDNSLNEIYKYIYNVVHDSNLCFEKVEIKTDKKTKNDYVLSLSNQDNSVFSLNFFLDDFYYQKESSENFKNYRDTTLKLILSILKKYNSRLKNIDEKLKECEDMDKYKIYGELVTANLYRIENKNIDSVTIENYYDENKLITIPLDKKYLPNENAKRFFKKYNKLKNTLEIVSIQKEETIKELDYIESVVYELEEASSTAEVAQIFDEISENVIFNNEFSKKQKSSIIKKTKLTKNKDVSFNPIKYIYNEYTILVGRNNKENDFLTLKYAKKDDLWFHTKDIHGSHVILKITDKNISDDVLYKCAELAAKHSKAKLSSNVPVDYCLVKNVKKPNGAKPGMVIYSNNKTIFVK